MILSDTAIKRPAFTTMVIAAIIVFGVISYHRIGIDLFPRVEFPVITIISVLPGADPETVETTVTDVIEEAVNTISGIKNLRSTSSDSISQVIIEFELEKNVDVAYQEIQAKLGTVRRDLPKDLEDPVVEKFDVDSAPIMSVVVSARMPIRKLTHLADKVVKERLQRIKNVGQVKLVGDQKRKIWIWLDRNRLEGYGLTVGDVKAAVRANHIEYPGGRVETGPMEYVVKTKGEFSSAQELSNLVVAYRNGAAVRIQNIGKAEDGIEEERSYSSLNGRRAVSLLVRRQSGTNTVQVAEAVKKEVEKLQKELASQGVKLEIAKNLSRFIEQSVEEVHFHLVFGGGLAILIVLIFLGNIRSTFICALVLPTAVIGTFSLMYGLNFTQNMMTLLALSLSIGLLIDDSIVVQENTMRHVEEGKPAREAASFATNEIGLSVFAISLCVVAVFVPVAFMKGIVGRFFYQFGLTVTFAVLISLFVAFTLDPMLSSRILKKPNPGFLIRQFDRLFGLVEWFYEKSLQVALNRRFLVVILALGVFFFTGKIGKYLRSEFIPFQDQSEFFIKVKAPLGSSIQTTRDIFEKIRQEVQKMPWVDYTFTTIGADQLERVNEGEMYVKMMDKEKRSINQAEAMQWAREKFGVMEEAKIGVEEVPRVSGGGRKNAKLQLEIRGADLEKLDKISQGIMEKMKVSPGFVDIDTTYENNKPESNVYIRRDWAADLGVGPLDIATTIKALIGGDDIAKFKAEGDRYDISVRLLESFRNRPENIGDLSVRNSRGRLIRLQNLVRVKKESGPVQIDRYNRTRQVTILANLDGKKKVLGEGVAELKGYVQKAGLPQGYSWGFAGQADTMKESFENLIFALFLAVLIVYMVLASLFESFLHPFTIMLSMPLSVIGALGALVLTGMTINIFTMIGIIMLMGLVSKNAILLVDYTNTLRERDGMDKTEALLKAGPTRFRPIIMTTLAMIFGMLPIAMGTGAGSETRAPMAVAVIGGLITSTLLTLIVVPAVYSLVDDLRRPSKWRVVKWIGGRGRG